MAGAWVVRVRARAASGESAGTVRGKCMRRMSDGVAGRQTSAAGAEPRYAVFPSVSQCPPATLMSYCSAMRFHVMRSTLPVTPRPFAI